MDRLLLVDGPAVVVQLLHLVDPDESILIVKVSGRTLPLEAQGEGAACRFDVDRLFLVPEQVNRLDEGRHLFRGGRADSVGLRGRQEACRRCDCMGRRGNREHEEESCGSSRHPPRPNATSAICPNGPSHLCLPRPNHFARGRADLDCPPLAVSECPYHPECRTGPAECRLHSPWLKTKPSSHVTWPSVSLERPTPKVDPTSASMTAPTHTAGTPSRGGTGRRCTRSELRGIARGGRPCPHRRSRGARSESGFLGRDHSGPPDLCARRRYLPSR